MSGESEGRDAAAKFRQHHSLGVGPIDDIIALMDLVDVDVIFVSAGESEHGLTARDTETGTTVFVVNSNLSSVRFRSTLAHELGHHVFREDLTASEGHDYASPSETRAHAFARHLLLPLDAVRAVQAKHPEFTDEELLNWCARRFGTSPKITAYQLKNATVIDADACARFAEMTTGSLAWRYGWIDLKAKRDTAVSVVHKPRRLHERATRSYLDGDLPAVELAAITGDSLDDINRMLPAPEPRQPPTISVTEIDLDDDLSDLP